MAHINANWLKCACAHVCEFVCDSVWVCARPLGEFCLQTPVEAAVNAVCSAFSGVQTKTFYSLVNCQSCEAIKHGQQGGEGDNRVAQTFYDLIIQWFLRQRRRLLSTSQQTRAGQEGDMCT